MSRNSSGVYTPAAGVNPVVDGTIISVTWGNDTVNDLAQGLTDSLDRQGRGSMLAALKLTDGTASVPGVSFANETSTGFYRAGTNDVRFRMAGATLLGFTPAGVTSLTQAPGNNTTLLATTAFVTAAVAAGGGGGGGSPGGLTTEIQFNNAGAFDGNANFTINDATGAVTFGVDTSVNGIIAGRGAGNDASNTVFGSSALITETTGTLNSAFGFEALSRNAGGVENTAFGYRAGKFNTGGGYNTAVGSNAMAAGLPTFSNSHNSAFGHAALTLLTTGIANTALGKNALAAITAASYGTAVGAYALDVATGANNTAVGYDAGGAVTSGANNVCLGYSSGTDAVRNITTASNEIVVGNNSHVGAYVKVAWTVTSDERDKCNFAPVPHGLDFVMQLCPTQFQFRMSRDSLEPSGPVRYGFRAQDIRRVEGAGGIIINDEDPDNLKYNESSLIPILVRAIQDLSNEVAELKRSLAL